MKRVDLATVVWCGLVLAGLSADVYLVRNDRRTLSQAARTPAGVIAQVLLLGHFANRLGRFDPFHAAANRIPRRTPCPIA